MHKNELTLFKEYFFIGLTRTSVINPQYVTEDEKKVIQRYKWWTVQELTNSNERFFPENLVELISLNK